MLLRGITRHNGDFDYGNCDGDNDCLNCLHSFRTENKLKSHEKVCKTKEFCGIVIPSEKDNILEFNQYKKSYIIHADIECLIKKNRWVCQQFRKIFSNKNKWACVPWGYSMSTIWAFNHIENKHTLYHGKDCMKKFYESLREHTKNIVDFGKKK